jgi:hypothetical protein
MSDTTPPPPSSAGHAFPPPPPPPPPGERKGMPGCLKYGLIGCGALLVLGILAAVAIGFWVSRNQDTLQGMIGGAAQEGARFGLGADEAACVQEATSRIQNAGSFSTGLSIGSFTRSCLEFSRETPGFCDEVQASAAIRPTVQQYCSEGRPKRTAADTLEWAVPDTLDAASDTLDTTF